jgi:Cdc6-like AAA superfamily ATPase
VGLTNFLKGEISEVTVLGLTKDRLSPGLVEAVSDSATTEVHDRNVELLSTHQRLLYEIISEASEIKASELTTNTSYRRHRRNRGRHGDDI